MATPLTLFGLGTKGLERLGAREQLDLQQLWVCRNARPFKGKIESSPGVSNFIAATVVGRPLKILAWERDDGTFRVNICTNQKIYRVHETLGTLTDITRLAGNYTGTVDELWDAIAFNNIFIATTSGRDPIQKWDGIAANAVDLGGTPPKARALMGLLTYVLLGDIDPAEVTPLPRKLQWSDSGNPELWVGGDAGFLTLFQGPGRIYRLLPIGEIGVAYRSNSVHIVFFVGPPFIFAQRQIFSDHGLIAPRAVTDLGARHLYWGTDNVYMFDGVNRVPVADRIIDEMNKSYDPKFRDMIIACLDVEDREVYFVYPITGSNGVPKNAWVFNYGTATWREEEIEVTACGPYRRLTGVTWDQATGSWDAQTFSWDRSVFAERQPIVLVGVDAGNIRFIDKATVDVVGAGRERIAETGLIDVGAKLFERPGIRCTLEHIDAEFEDKGAHNLEVWIGTQNQLRGDGQITFTQFNVPMDGTKRKISIRKSARYFTIRLRTAGAAQPYRGSGLLAHFEPRGDR